MTCVWSLRTQAYFDAEVDAPSAAALEQHVEQCVECQALLADLEASRALLRRAAASLTAPAPLAARLRQGLDREAPAPVRSPAARRRPPPFWLGVLTGLAGAAGALLLAAMLPLLRADPLLDELVAAHLRSLMPMHLIDVASTDRHTVKPWFAGHADVSPVVADFAAQGFRLVGGRADYLDRQRSAVVVYQHGAHLINVFSWHAAAPRLPASTTRSGYRVACWTVDDLGYCAVSDAGWEELRALERLLQENGE